MASDFLLAAAHSDPACRGAPIELWFPPPGGSPMVAKAICLGCDLLQQCRDWALTQNPYVLYGVWGGLTQDERMKLVRR